MPTNDSGSATKPRVLYACSGAADSGQIADLARRLPFTEVVITNQGVIKGSTPATPEVVERVADSIKAGIDGK